MEYNFRISLLFIFSLFISETAYSQTNTTSSNQVGFCINQPKTLILNEEIKTYEIINNTTGKTVLKGNSPKAINYVFSNEAVRLLDISHLKKQGTYYLKSDNIKGQEFNVSKKPYEEILKSSIKAFYLTRASLETTKRHAGVYARKMGHPDDSVLIHSSAASEKRPENTIIKSPGGWYDAGDYNKYIVNSGITTYTLLRAYENFKKPLDKLNLNIPESNNSQADILDEIEYNINWMLTMQDPEDGGVYHKLTTKNFSGFVKPHEAISARYVVQKSVTASLDFAAVIAYYARLLDDEQKTKELISKAEKAYEWAKANPKAYFKNPEDIKTGEYGDQNAEDEFFWAEVELFISTRGKYYNTGRLMNCFLYDSPSWKSVKALGVISLASSNINSHKEKATKALLTLANKLEFYGSKNAYGNTLGRLGEKEFNWGSNSNLSNQTIILIEALRLSKNKKYEAPIFNNIYYLLGQNPTGYCFVTGFGHKQVLNPHHRPSGSDGIKMPYPGLLAGGPNLSKQDKNWVSTYTSDLPALSYSDDEASYASNEIAINWNAPLVYLLSFAHSY